MTNIPIDQHITLTQYNVGIENSNTQFISLMCISNMEIIGLVIRLKHKEFPFPLIRISDIPQQALDGMS